MSSKIKMENKTLKYVFTRAGKNLFLSIHITKARMINANGNMKLYRIKNIPGDHLLIPSYTYPKKKLKHNTSSVKKAALFSCLNSRKNKQRSTAALTR